MIDMLLSIKPIFAARILTGEKTWEFRKVFIQDPRIEKMTVYIYASAPVQAIVGSFRIQQVRKVYTENLDYFCLLGHQLIGPGISPMALCQYVGEKEYFYAIKTDRVRAFLPHVDPYMYDKYFRPPQAYQYTDTLNPRIMKAIEKAKRVMM